MFSSRNAQTLDISVTSFLIIFEELFTAFKYFSGLFPKGLMPDGTTRFTCQGKPLSQLLRIGAFSEYVVLPEMSVVKVSTKI